jgi:MGT family glycosyltransferase
VTRFAFVTWDGGGNVPPAIGIARELQSRGHVVRFLGYSMQRAGIEGHGFAFSSLVRSGDFDLYGERPAEQRLPAIIRNVWACPEHLEDIPEFLDGNPADVVVVDFLLQGALAQARRMATPVAVLAHSSIAGLVPPPQSPMGAARIAAANGFRSEVGLQPLARLNDGWAGLPTIVTTIPELDPEATAAGESVLYVGPILDSAPGPAWDSAWTADDRRPLILVSFSTTRFWDQSARIRNTLDALAAEPVRVLVSASASSLPATLPRNAVARSFVPHSLVLPTVAVTVTHCGHGTVSASLAHGVPIVGLPNAAADQPFLAARVQELGAGIALDGESSPKAIRRAVRDLLAHPSYRDAARRLGAAISATPGAAGAAAELERLAFLPHGSVRTR